MTRLVHLIAALVLAACTFAATGTSPATGATGQIAPTVTILSQTQINAGGCGAGPATTFGLVMAGTSANPGADCTVTFGSSNDTPMLHAYQSDGIGSAMYRMTTGKLDQNWDASAAGNGAINVPGNADIATWNWNRPPVAVQPTTGRFVMAYSRSVTGALNVVRFEDDGDLDPTFATAGRYTNSSYNFATVSAMAIAPDGSIFVASRENGTSRWIIVKLTPSGALDTTFDGDSGTGNGVVIFDHFVSISFVYGMILARDGDLVVYGYEQVASYDAAVLRLGPTGRVDTAFGGGDGFVNANLGGNTLFNDGFEMADGRLVFGGWEWMTNPDAVFARMLPDGTLDPTFDGPGTGLGNDGLFSFPAPSGADSYVSAVGLLPDGDIIGVGDMTAGGNDAYAVRLNPADGSLDTAWDGPSGTGNGRVRLTLSANYDDLTDVYVSDAGEIFALGTTNPSGSNIEPVLVKLRNDGTLDPDFDGDSGSANGAVVVTGSASNDMAYHLSSALDGDLVATTQPATGAPSLMRMIRFDGNAVPDYDDDDVASDNNWTEGTGFFGVCLRQFTGTSATATWSTNATCPADDTSDHWRAVPPYGTAAKVGQIANRAVDGTARFRFALRAPLDQTPGAYVAPVTFDVIAPAV